MVMKLLKVSKPSEVSNSISENFHTSVHKLRIFIVFIHSHAVMVTTVTLFM